MPTETKAPILRLHDVQIAYGQIPQLERQLAEAEAAVQQATAAALARGGF